MNSTSNVPGRMLPGAETRRPSTRERRCDACLYRLGAAPYGDGVINAVTPMAAFPVRVGKHVTRGTPAALTVRRLPAPWRCLLIDRILERIAGGELHRSGRSDRRLLTGCRITAGPLRPRAREKQAEADRLDSFAAGDGAVIASTIAPIIHQHAPCARWRQWLGAGSYENLGGSSSQRGCRAMVTASGIFAKPSTRRAYRLPPLAVTGKRDGSGCRDREGRRANVLCTQRPAHAPVKSAQGHTSGRGRRVSPSRLRHPQASILAAPVSSYDASNREADAYPANGRRARPSVLAGSAPRQKL